jgi:hypothetical protein
MDFVRHFRDLLIALEAAQAGATLVTENARDFARWKSLLASTRKTLKLLDIELSVFMPRLRVQGIAREPGLA